MQGTLNRLPLLMRRAAR